MSFLTWLKWWKNTTVSDNRSSTDIAIIGMACRFPGATNYTQFWNNLVQGVNSIKEITPDRWDINKYYSPVRNAPNKSISKWGGLLDQIDSFDASFFNISPDEAKAMDPQQRLLLEETWHCIEDAGLALKELQGHNTAVYVGVMSTDYHQYISDPAIHPTGYSCLGNYEGILANRLSYFFNFTGESLSIDAACASSLVALHEARRALISGESDYAIAAGVNVICHPMKYISFSHAHMLSPDGQCKTFDAAANGYVPGEGVAVLLLESLSSALEKGHHIYGILKGSAVHHSGKTKSITAPKIEAQRGVIEEALAAAKVSSETITYLEAHGTGTSLGDPMEIEALTQAFHTSKKQYCRIGSVKTNIGHAEAAAGLAGVIKVLLMLQHRKIPKTLNIKNVNPIIDFENSPFCLANECTNWQLPTNIPVRRAGVSSFGFGGIDSHVVIEEYIPSVVPADQVDKEVPFILSAKTEKSLTNLLKRWQQYVRTESFKVQSLHDICYTLMHGREALAYRFGTTIQNKKALIQVIEDAYKNPMNLVATDVQYQNNTIIYRLQSRPRVSYSEFYEACQNFPVLALLIVESEQVISSLQNNADPLRALRISNFIVLYILGKALLMSGLQPRYVMGDGVGELAAAVISGILDFKTAIQWLLGTSHDINLKRPNINFYSVQKKEIIQPYHVTKQYCRKLVETLEIDTTERENIFKLTRTLQPNQFTFRKYLSQGESLLEKYGISLKKVLDDYPVILERNQEMVLLIGLLISLKKLNLKWDLTEKIIVDNPSAIEIIDLAVDGVLTNEQIIELLLDSKDATFQKTADYIQKQQHFLDPNKPYTLLKQFNQTLPEIPDAKLWLESLFREDHAVTSMDFNDVQNPWYIDIGSGKHYHASENMTALNTIDLIDALPEFLIDLWRLGAPMDWQQWYSRRECQRLALPTYDFLQEHYWFKQDNHHGKEKKLTIPVEAPKASVPPVSLKAIETTDLAAFSLQYLQRLFSEVLRLPTEQLSPDVTYEVFGLDSVKGVEIIKRLELDFGSLSQTLLFEKNRLQRLSDYLQQNHDADLKQLYAKIHDDSFVSTIAHKEGNNLLRSETAVPIDESERDDNDAIAIIGISGKYPEAENLAAFWQNLKNGRDCITRVPKNRWRPEDYPVTTSKGTRYYDQGGFITDVDKFDPLFFNISPWEASVMMDPQERLFLQTAWATIEDAGYTRLKIEKTAQNQVGVFVGVTYQLYPLYHAEEWFKNNRLPLDIQFYSIANRVSYFFNFNGPSFPVDTACSSSLSAIHLACESIKRGECKMALAGGVNLSLHPGKYYFLGATGFMSEQGRCTSFAAGGTGYVPSEGVGAILLKPLSQALADKDHIYGVIRATSMNHGGKTSGYTVPNPIAQADLITAAIAKSRIDPRTISYVEAHGTGTALGDPIEIRGLQLSFEKYTQDKQFCAIGSVKSNIGHAEAAAGISQVTKVLLQLQHHMLVPSIHAETLNPYIDFPQTPFYLQRELAEWKTINDVPRRAGISSFGAGGANAHMIVEEFVASHSASTKEYSSPFIFILSASDINVLRQYVENFYQYLLLNKDNAVNLNELLANICYTLQIGREAMPARFGVVVKDYQELLQKLASYLQNQQQSFAGTTEYETLVSQWVSGQAINWEILYPSTLPDKVPLLPTYPFIKRRCWIPGQAYFSDEEKPPEDNKKKITSIEPPKDKADWLYANVWKKADLNSKTIVNQTNDWLIFSDKLLSPLLQEKIGKQHYTLCVVGDKFAKLDANTFSIHPENADDYKQLLLEITNKHSKLTDIIYMWPLDQSDTTDNEPAKASSRFLFLLQAIIKQTKLNKSRVWLITRGSQVVNETDSVQIWQHHLWAISNIFATEQPEYSVKRIDLDGQIDLAVQANWLQQVLQQASNEDFLAYRQHQAYVLRLTQKIDESQHGFNVPKRH